MSLGSSRLVACLVVRFLFLQPLIFRCQDAVQLFDESQELLPVLLDRDKRAELVNVIAVRFVHRERGSITTLTAFCMFDVERCWK